MSDPLMKLGAALERIKVLERQVKQILQDQAKVKSFVDRSLFLLFVVGGGVILNLGLSPEVAGKLIADILKMLIAR